MPPKRRNESDSDPKQPRARRGQKKAQLDNARLDTPLHTLPAEPHLQQPEKPKPRPRGRPKVAATPACGMEGPLPTPASMDTDKGIHTPPQKPDEPSPKRSESDMNVDILEPSKGKPARGQRLTKVVPAREPLPDRAGRNIHPVKPKATHHTPHEVAAHCEAQVQELQERIRAAEEAKELLAQMNVDEELDDEQLLIDNPQRLSAAIRKCGRDLLEDSEGEGFDFDAVEKGSYSDDEVVEPVKRKTVSHSCLNIVQTSTDLLSFAD